MNLAERKFSDPDQKQFAAVSGDSNPIHVDALYARRTKAGAPVVHGIHLLLWALDSLGTAQPNLPPMRSLRAQFNKFVYLDEHVELVLSQQSATGARLTITVDNAPRSKVAIEFGRAVQDCPAWSTSSLEPVPLPSSPLDLDLDQMCDRSGRLSFQMTQKDATSLFPAATKWLGARRVAALAASTQLIGMVCPGLHSIYGGLSVHACADPTLGDSLAFRVTETDSRFRSVEQEITGGGMTGTVQSFARTPPVLQATMHSLAGLTSPTEFAGSVVLIVGGSRGLGELTAKLVAAGGGRPIVTWQTGKEDAERVAQEIRSGGGMCETLAYDVRNQAAGQFASRANTFTHAYYFATPTIYRSQSEVFVSERLNEFLDIYVDGFWRLSQALRVLQPSVSIFYPSSVFVEERPREMTEYTMAKAAGEVLCADMNASLAPMHVTVKRLPRLSTDQTATVAAVEMADSIGTMLPIVREVQSWPRR